VGKDDTLKHALSGSMAITLSKMVSVLPKRYIDHTHWNGRAFFGVYV